MTVAWPGVEGVFWRWGSGGGGWLVGSSGSERSADRGSERSHSACLTPRSRIRIWDRCAGLAAGPVCDPWQRSLAPLQNPFLYNRGAARWCRQRGRTGPRWPWRYPEAGRPGEGAELPFPGPVVAGACGFVSDRCQFPREAWGFELQPCGSTMKCTRCNAKAVKGEGCSLRLLYLLFL